MPRPSPIHEKAVHMIAEACRRGYEQKREYTGIPRDSVLVRLHPKKDEWSPNLMEDIAKVKVADPEWDSVGGIAPDLILYDANDRPKRIIEVIVTSPPDASKRQKLQRLKERGVDVVEVAVKTEDDLRDLFPPLRRPNFAANPQGNTVTQRALAQTNHGASRTLDELTIALIQATPAARRRFLHVLKAADALNSVYPTPEMPPEEK